MIFHRYLFAFRRLCIAGLVSACAATPTPTAVAVNCTLINRYESNTVPVFQSSDRVVSFHSNLDVNTDGALRSYGEDDPGYYGPDDTHVRTRQALNTICNGAYVRNRAGRTIAGAGQCREILRHYDRIRAANWRPQNGDYMYWFGIASDPNSRNGAGIQVAPCIRDGWLVSQTARAMDSTLSVCDPDHWIDALRIPAIVLPLDAAMQRAGVAMFDLAVVRNPQTGLLVGAIVGDTNPTKIGEGTVALALALRPDVTAPSNYRQTIALAIDHADYFVFPGTAGQLSARSNGMNTEVQAAALALARRHNIATRPVCTRPA